MRSMDRVSERIAGQVFEKCRDEYGSALEYMSIEIQGIRYAFVGETKKVVKKDGDEA